MTTVFDAIFNVWQNPENMPLDYPSEVCEALGLDPDTPLAELKRKAPCRCPIMTKAVYREMDEVCDDCGMFENSCTCVAYPNVSDGSTS